MFWIILILVATPSCAIGQAIGFAQCSHTVQVGDPFDMTLQYIDDPNGGIVGADVRIKGLPLTWLATVLPPPIPNPCGLLPCDLFGLGASLQFPGCQTDPVVLLFNLTIVPLDVRSDVVLMPTFPVGSSLECPFVTLCDGPVFTKVCVGCDSAIINPSSGGCPVAVEQQTFSSIRILYR